MNDTDKRKTLYDEIFSENKAPQVTDSNGVQEIKDAIDNKKFDDKDMVNLEDIFVLDNEAKDNKVNAVSSSLKSTDNDDGCLLEDAKYYDLINNTLVDLRLNLEEVKAGEGEFRDVNLDNIIKKDDDVKYDEIRPVTFTVDDKDTASNPVENIVQNQSSVKLDVAKVEPAKKVLPFWINYAFVAALVAVSIVGSLTFLMKQFMR